jgi:hypothetical protein
MTAMRSALLAVFVAVFALAAPVGAWAEPLPVYNGLMDFGPLHGPEDPEEFSWEVSLGEEQELRQLDERTAGVFYEDETEAFTIQAVAAHDADGATVPTTLAVAQPNVITLTVHHRDAPFVYPVTEGTGWEGGFHTEPVVVLEPNQEGPTPPPPTCVVPDLTGRSLRASRKLLHQSHCRLGAVRGEQVRAAHVVKQYRQFGKSLPLWTKVDVKALTGLQYVRAN